MPFDIDLNDMESVEDPGKVMLDPDYMTLEEAQNIIVLTIHEDNDEAQIAYEVIEQALNKLKRVEKALGNELNHILNHFEGKK
jgi:hypothetical protein